MTTAIPLPKLYPLASAVQNGLMSAADKAMLDALSAGWAPITQSAWEISSSGNDNNSGAPGSPLATLAGLRNKLAWGALTVNATVTILNNLTGLSANHELFSVRGYGGVSLNFVGGRTVLETHAISAVTNWVSSSFTKMSTTFATVSSTIAAFGGLGQMMRINGGPRDGATSWVLRETSAKVAAGPQWYDAGFFSGVTAQVGDSVQFCTLRRMNGNYKINVFGDMYVTFTELDIGMTSGDWDGFSVIVLDGNVQFFKCLVHGLSASSSNSESNTALVSSRTDNGCNAYGSMVLFATCHDKRTTSSLFARAGARLLSFDGCIIAQDAMQVERNAHAIIDGGLAIYAPSTAMIVYDSGQVRVDGYVWAENAITLGWDVRQGGWLRYSTASHAPSLQGTQPTNAHSVAGQLSATTSLPTIVGNAGVVSSTFGGRSTTLSFGNTGLGTSGTRYLQPGYSPNAAGTSLRHISSPNAATRFSLFLENGAAGTVTGGTGTYTFQLGTVTNDVFTGSGVTVVMAVADRQASVSGAITVTAGQRVAIQSVAGGTGTITASPSEVMATLVLFE